MEIPGPQGKTRECASDAEGLGLNVGGCPSLLWASTLSFDSLSCGVCPAEVWLAKGDEVLSGPSCLECPEGSSQLSLRSSRPPFFCISPARRSLGSELSHGAALARSC